MKYILELSTMSGDGLAEEQWSLFESDTPLPIPNVEDRIVIQGRAATVVKRALRIFGTDPLTMHFQVLCRDITPTERD